MSYVYELPSRSLKFRSRTKRIPAGAVFEFLFPSGLLRKTAFGSSSGGGAEQFWQTDEIVGGHRQREFEAQTPASTQHGPGESANGLGPAERLLDQLALLLADRVTGKPGGMAIDRRSSISRMLSS